MSRVGKKSIPIPDSIKISNKNKVITVQGDKGTLTRSIHPSVDLVIKDGFANVAMVVNDRKSRSLQGLTRSLIANMVTGVDKGFEWVLEIHGIGYRAELKANSIVLNVGYSRPVNFTLPEGVSASISKNNVIKLSAIDKELLGRTAASIRQIKPPEPYKGKGIKYAEEYIRRKAGKTGVK